MDTDEVTSALERAKGPEESCDETTLDPARIVIRSGPWFVFARAHRYNSTRRTNARPYLARGEGPLTGRQILAHIQRIVAHAAEQDAARFLEGFTRVALPDGTPAIRLEFGS